MFRVWTKNLDRVGKSEAHVYFLALTCSDAELGKPFLLKGNFISFSKTRIKKTDNTEFQLFISLQPSYCLRSSV